MANDDHQSRIFEGFSSPSFTQTPNVFFDELMPDLKEAELKVLLYIIRRTWGFAGKQEGDAISLNQLCNGIVTSKGERLDRGTGLSKAGVAKALLSLRTKGIIVRIKNRDSVRGDTPTIYRLRMRGEPVDAKDEPPPGLEYPVSTVVDTGVYGGGHPLSTGVDTRVYDQTPPVSTGVDTQKKVEQNKELLERPFEYSNEIHTKINYSEARIALQPYILDFAREFADTAKPSSTLSRAVNLCERSGVDVDDFIDTMLAARSKTQEFSGSIKSRSGEGDWARKNKIPYFFKVLEDMLGLKGDGKTA